MSKKQICPFELEPSWQQLLAEEFEKPYILELAAFVERERLKGGVYPPADLVFNAFWRTPYHKVKVVLMGQDPYHGPGQAHGLSFSVPKGVLQPPSLQNIFKEIKEDLGIEPPSHGCLISWAEQGVLMLNATLTVSEGEPMSHHKRGWEYFTDAVIAKLCKREDPAIFVLWGKSAREKFQHISESMSGQHVVLTAAHPSPFSARNGFFGCRHFSKINSILEQRHKTPIDWRIV